MSYTATIVPTHERKTNPNSERWPDRQSETRTPHRSSTRRTVRPSSAPRRASRTSVILLVEASRPRACRRLRATPRSTSTTSVIWPGRGDITTTRFGQVDRLGYRVRHEHDRRVGSGADSGAAQTACARGSSRRAHRTARPSAAAVDARPVLGRSQSAVACLRTIPTVDGHRNSESCTSSSISADRSARRFLSQPFSSSGSSMFFANRAPVEQIQTAGTPCRSPGRAWPVPPTYRSPNTSPAVGAEQVGNQPEQRRLAATGRTDEGHEVACRDVEIDVAQRLQLAGAPRLNTIDAPLIATACSVILWPPVVGCA